MKNAMILVGLWVGIILAAYAFVYLDGGGPTTAQLALLERLAERTYFDSGGLYEIETSPGWRVTEIEDGVHLVGPVEEIEAWVLGLGPLPASEAIAIACGLANPCPGLSVLTSEDLDPPPFASAKERITYASENEGLLLYGVGFETSAGTYVLLVRGEAEACDRRKAELALLEESFQVLGVSAVPAFTAAPIDVSQEDGAELSDPVRIPGDTIDVPPESGDVDADSDVRLGTSTQPALEP